MMFDPIQGTTRETTNMTSTPIPLVDFEVQKGETQLRTEHIGCTPYGTPQIRKDESHS